MFNALSLPLKYLTSSAFEASLVLLTDVTVPTTVNSSSSDIRKRIWAEEQSQIYISFFRPSCWAASMLAARKLMRTSNWSIHHHGTTSIRELPPNLYLWIPPFILHNTRISYQASCRFPLGVYPPLDPHLLVLLCLPCH
jgi:hypothetical protein